jgi:GNAT superfamily N-acetyltransferase
MSGLAADNQPVSNVEVRPVTPDRWTDMVALFGANGASSGCWCMWFRVPPKVYSANRNKGNRAAMQERVAAGDEPGLIAYEAGLPVGWVSVAPRRDFARIETKADRGIVSEENVWSVVCFFIAPGRRGEGVASALLAAAVDYARAHGARALEAYPVDRDSPISNGDAYTGVRTMYSKAGFLEVGRFDRWAAIPDVAGPAAKALVRPPGRPVMRLEL